MVTKEQLKDAKRLIREYERERRREERRKTLCRPCASVAYAYLSVKNDGYGYESWDDKDRKFYRKILSTETAEVRRISRRIGSAQTDLDFERRRKHRWTPAMVDALQKGDSAFLEQCGITEAAANAMRWRMKSASAREAV